MHQRAAELRQLIRLTELVVILGDLAEPRQASLEELPAAERPGLAGLADTHPENLRGVDLDDGDAPADFGQLVDRMSGESGQRGSVRVDLGGGRLLKKNK